MINYYATRLKKMYTINQTPWSVLKLIINFFLPLVQLKSDLIWLINQAYVINYIKKIKKIDWQPLF